MILGETPCKEASSENTSDEDMNLQLYESILEGTGQPILSWVWDSDEKHRALGFVHRVMVLYTTYDVKSIRRKQSGTKSAIWKHAIPVTDKEYKWLCIKSLRLPIAGLFAIGLLVIIWLTTLDTVGQLIGTVVAAIGSIGAMILTLKGWYKND
jgi:uncharacterized membrane protein